MCLVRFRFCDAADGRERGSYGVVHRVQPTPREQAMQGREIETHPGERFATSRARACKNFGVSSCRHSRLRGWRCIGRHGGVSSVLHSSRQREEALNGQQGGW